jgi:outer membrane phospholipase A
MDEKKDKTMALMLAMQSGNLKVEPKVWWKASSKAC